MINNKEQNVLDEKILQDTSLKKEKETEEPYNIENVTDLRDKRIIELEIELIQTKKNERENFLRAKAEVENIRRRSEIDIEKAHKFALEHFIAETLSVIDNLERALEISNKSNEKLECTIEGIELTLKSFLEIMKKYGIEIIDSINVPFNPLVHQAMTVLESEENIPNQVIMIMQKGYTLNGRLIRPAMVAVSKSKNQ